VPVAEIGFKFSVDGAPQSSLALAFQGRLMEVINQSMNRVETAYVRAMDVGVTQPGKQKLRATIEATGFYRASALAKTWRGYTYNDRPNDRPAASFKSRAGVIVDAFEQGVTITAHNSKFLAIPEGPAKAIVHNLNKANNRSREGGKFAKEDSTVARVASALGTDLVPLIDTRTGRGVLVAKSGLRLTRGGHLAKKQTGRPTPIFALIRSATLKPRPMGRAVLAEIRSSAVEDFTRALAGILGPDDR